MPPSCTSTSQYQRSSKDGVQEEPPWQLSSAQGAQLLHKLTIAMAAAMSPSVTVSMGELTTGMLKRSLRVSWVANATCRGTAWSSAAQSGPDTLKKQTFGCARWTLTS